MRHYGRVIQGGNVVASVSANDRDSMLRELSHYAAVYAQDGSIQLQTRQGKSAWRSAPISDREASMSGEKDYPMKHNPKAGPDRVALAIFDMTPDLGAGTPEPNLRQIVFAFYAHHFSTHRAAQLTDQYIAALSPQPASDDAAGEAA